MDRRRIEDDREPLARWLAAEEAGDDTAAEESLGALFAALPELAPAPGLAGRVLAAARQAEPEPETEPERRRRAARPPARLLAAVAAAVALGAAGALALLARLAPALELGPVVAAPGAAVVSLLGMLGRWASPLLDSVLALGRLLGVLVAEAGVLLPAMLVVLLLVGALSFKLLHDLLQGDRSLTYADSI